MYTIHKTEGIILFKKPRGEANQVFFIATRELGCLYAVAQGSRAISSKLRYNLGLFNPIIVDLVRGKDVWRVTSVISKNVRPLSPERAAVFGRVAALVKRLTHGEEKNEKLFDILSSVRNYLGTSETIDERGVEEASALKLLDAFGYGTEGVLSEVVSKKLEDSIELIHPLRKEAIRHINQALAESHL